MMPAKQPTGMGVEKPRVPFLCTHNAALSQMAEAPLRRLQGLPKLTGRRTSPFERRPNGHADRFATGFSDGNANACRSASTRSGTSR